MNKEKCAVKLVDEIILYYDAQSKKHQITVYICLIPQYCRGPNQMVHSTTVILMSLMYRIANMKEAQLMFNIFTTSVHDNLL